MKIAVFPGSFDPITLGHVDIINRGIPLFDQIIIAIGVNADKKYMFSLEQRMQFITEIYAQQPKVKVMTYQGLTVDFCKQQDAQYILRGLRNTNDMIYENHIAQANKAMTGVESVFLLSDGNTAFISSTIARDIIRNGGDASTLLPHSVNY